MIRRATLLTLFLAPTAVADPVDFVVRERGTGDPVPEARITLPDGSEVETSERGRVVLDLPDGVHELTIASLPHALLTAELTVPLSKARAVVFLAPLPDGGEVIVEAFRPTSHGTRHLVDAEMAYETPGTYDDAVRLVQALPGVNIQREYSPTSGDVSVRGSLPGDNRYFLDGIEVPYLYHFNQYASVFPASQLDSLELFSSGYGVRYGDAVGAVVEARSDTHRPDAVAGSASLNFVTAGAEMRAPLPNDWWVSVSGRRSYQDLASEDNPQYTLWPVLHDFSVRAEHGNEDHGTGIFAWGAGDRYARAAGELDVLDPLEATQTASFDYTRNFQIAGVRHRWKAGDIVVGVVHDRVQASLTSGGREDLRTLSLTSRGDLHGRLSRVLSWQAGWELRNELSWLEVDPAGYDGVLVAAESPALAWGVDVEARPFRAQLASYGELHAQLGPVRLMPGLRAGWDSRGLEALIEPRLTAKWRVANQTELKLVSGRYQQRPETLELLVQPDLPTTTSWEIAGGLEQTFGGRIELDLEGYHKWLTHPLLARIDGPPQAMPSGRAYGAELTTRYRLREQFFLWTWVAWSRSMVSQEDGTLLPTLADQPWSGGLVASWNITAPWNIAVRYRLASGLPWTPIEGSLYDATRDTWVPTLGAPNSERYPLYQKVDLHVAYTATFRRWALTLSADIWIVPKSAAQLYPTWNYDYSEQGWVIGPTVLPLFGARATF